MSSGAAALLPGSGNAAHDRYVHHLTRDAVSYSVERLLESLLLRTLTVAQPAVGAEWSQIVPAGVIWELLAVRFLFATSATVSNRAASVQIRDSDGIQSSRFSPGGTVAASNSPTHVFTAGYGATSGNGPICSPLPAPPVVLVPGWSVASLTSSLDAGDQYSGIVLTVRELAPGRILNSLRVILTDFESTGMLDQLGRDEIYGATIQ